MPAFAPAAVETLAREGGGIVLRSPTKLAQASRCLGDMLERWANEAPDRTFLAERVGDSFRRVSYSQARSTVRGIAQSLLDMGATVDRPIMLLSDNGVDHALVQLAAMHVGLPASPISPAYSLLSQDHAKLREIAAMLRPSAIYAIDGNVFARAFDALDLDVPHLTSRNPPAKRRGVTIDELSKTSSGRSVDEAFAAIGPDTIGKVLFTSGSTGAPKGVINTQRMMCCNQEAIAQLWPFLAERPPVVVDWLPWSHTFGGNHNFNMVLRHGGTLYVDSGKPVPGRIEETVRNLREIPCTAYFNVPRGFDALLPFLERDEALRRTFFSELSLIFYAAAALPQNLWVQLERIALDGQGRRVPFVSAWGLTETSPLVTSVHFPIDRAGVIGLPAPGCELALVPSLEKLEMRVKGPNVTPGYWETGGGVRPLPLDDHGFFCTGDAGRLEDPNAPEKGVVFDGRTAENFKLTSGTWVTVGALRVAVIAACAPLVQDAVVAGHDRDDVSLLVFPNVEACRALGDAEARRRVIDGLQTHNRAHAANSMRVARAIFLADPPSIDAGEITDKGYINQRAVLTRRAAIVARLYAGIDDSEVMTVPLA